MPEQAPATRGKAALLVDVPHLLASAGGLLLATRARPLIGCEFDKLATGLVELLTSEIDASIAESYWYDVAVPSPDQYQHALAELPGVSARLGRFVSGRPKGLDARIVRDMLLFASDEGVQTFFLLSGDKDLREAVRDVQEMGARVVLIGIPELKSDGSPRLVPSYHMLLRETDDHVVPAVPFWERYFFRRSPNSHGIFTIPVGDGMPGPPRRPHEEQALQAGYDFAFQWASEASPEKLHELFRRRFFSWTIPPELDARLQETVATWFPQILADSSLRMAVRSGFWAGLDATLKDMARALRAAEQTAEALAGLKDAAGEASAEDLDSTDEGAEERPPALPTYDAFEMAARDMGEDYAEQWRKRAHPSQIAALAAAPFGRWIPRDIDAQLLAHADRELRSKDTGPGFLAVEPELKLLVRAGFLAALAKKVRSDQEAASRAKHEAEAASERLLDQARQLGANFATAVAREETLDEVERILSPFRKGFTLQPGGISWRLPDPFETRLLARVEEEFGELVVNEMLVGSVRAGFWATLPSVTTVRYLNEESSA